MRRFPNEEYLSPYINIIENELGTIKKMLQMYKPFKIALITNLKEMLHCLNILLRACICTLHSQTDFDKLLNPKVMQLNPRFRKESV